MATIQPVLKPVTIQKFEEYLKRVYQETSFLTSLRQAFERIDLEYTREGNRGDEHRLAIRSLRAGDKSRLADLTIPVIMPQIESALASLSQIFLSGNPIFPMVAAPGNVEAVEAMEAEISVQSKENGWVRDLLKALNDGLKYNILAVECDWVNKLTYELKTDFSFSKTEAAPTKKYNPQNKVNRVDPYNFIFDPLVSPGDIHTNGEYAGYFSNMSRIALFDYIKSLPQQFVQHRAFKQALSESSSDTKYYEPLLSNYGATPGKDDWSNFPNFGPANPRTKEKAYYEITKLYARIVAEDFDISPKNDYTPEIWKLVFINHSTLIYAEKLTNAHNYLPIISAQIIEDGLEYKTKSYAENLIPVQDTASTLFNYYIASARRSVSDRGLYDPLRIKKEDINSTNPAAKIPVKPSAYGKGLGDAYQQIPFDNRDSVMAIQNAFNVIEFGRTMTGVNRAQEGNFVKGNKSRREFATIMGNSDARLLLPAMRLEAQLFTPLKEVIKTNILQYKDLNEVFSPITRKVLKVNMEEVRQSSLYFKLADGMDPSQRQYDTEFIQYFFNLLATTPALQAEYEIVKVISYLAQSRGFGEIKFFERSLEEKAALMSQGIPQNATPQPE